MSRAHAHTLGSLFGPLIRAGAKPEHWRPTLPVAGLAVDSRSVAPGYVFFARPGVRSHGIAFVDDAIAAGAAAVVLARSEPAGAGRDYRLPTLRVHEVSTCLGACADRFYGEPSRRLHVVGVTGTNGKTSVTHCVAQALAVLGGRCGLIGTLGQGIHGEPLSESRHTTPDVVELHARLAAFVEAGARYAAIEVSSHGLDQGRLEGVRFAVAALTNLSRDHLDYHRDESAYRAAKRRLFAWPGLRAAVINADDRFGAELLAASGVPALAYQVTEPGRLPAPATGAACRLWAEVEAAGAAGIRLMVHGPGAEEGVLETSLIGRFNARNVLAALGVLLELGYPFGSALCALARVHAPAGRMERVASSRPGLRPTVVVDYAHTPAALRAALDTLAPLTAGDLWCVFGCGGDRDRGKRVLMGEVARDGADRVVLTSDNPRSEPPRAIIDDILEAWEGRGAPPTGELVVEPDRREAIRFAVRGAGPDDIVLIAGKGHEPYQLIGEEVLAFDDREVARAVLEETPRC